jgi:uncharacterized iron-regulated membrane protein
MNDLITRLQETLSEPDLWSKPATWIAVGCGVLFLVLVARLMFRRKKPAEPQPARRFDPRASGGAFGALTPALASQIPESQKEK